MHYITKKLLEIKGIYRAAAAEQKVEEKGAKRANVLPNAEESSGCTAFIQIQSDRELLKCYNRHPLSLPEKRRDF